MKYLYALTYLNIQNNVFSREIDFSLVPVISRKSVAISDLVSGANIDNGIPSSNFRPTFPNEFVQIRNLKELYLSNNSLTGTVSELFCSLPQLKILEINSNDVSCYPACLNDLELLLKDESIVAKSKCPSVQDSVLCSVIAATDVERLYSEWSCSSDGVPLENPCRYGYASGSWNGLACIGDSVVEIEMHFLTGKVH